jgi:hypothetical protein
MPNKKRAGPLSLTWVRAIDNWENFPMMTLQAIAEARTYLSAVERASVLRARELGATWEDLAGTLGMTRQGLINRYKDDFGPGHSAEEADQEADRLTS